MQRTNQRTGKLAQEFLEGLRLGYRIPSPDEKAALAKKLEVPSSSFDMLQDRETLPVLIEVKGTKRRSAREHFFSVSATEKMAARKVGNDRYRFVIVYDLDRKPHHQEFTWDELWSRRRSVTIQYSMRLKPKES